MVFEARSSLLPFSYPDLLVRYIHRQAPKGFPNYAVQKTEAELRRCLKYAGILDYTIQIPESPLNMGVRYDIWIEFHKLRGFECLRFSWQCVRSGQRQIGEIWLEA
jgi:hypothetical protein